MIEDISNLLLANTYRVGTGTGVLVEGGRLFTNHHLISNELEKIDGLDNGFFANQPENELPLKVSIVSAVDESQQFRAKLLYCPPKHVLIRKNLSSAIPNYACDFVALRIYGKDNIPVRFGGLSIANYIEKPFAPIYAAGFPEISEDDFTGLVNGLTAASISAFAKEVFPENHLEVVLYPVASKPN